MSDPLTSVDEPLPGPRSYHAFVLGPDGSVERTEAIDAETDDEAAAIAARLVNGHGIDLWERGRLLASFPGSAAPGSGD